MKQLLTSITEFINRTANSIADMFRDLMGKGNRSSRRTASSRSAAPQPSRRGRSSRSRRLTFGEKLAMLWAKFLAWLKQVDRRFLYAAGGALVIVIILPIILVSVLGGGADEKQPAEEVTEQIVQAEESVPAVSAVSAIAVQEYVDGNVVETEAEVTEAEPMTISEEEPEKEIDPRSIDAETVYLKAGEDDPLVAKVQEMLMDLGYMDYDIPTEHFGPHTQEAVTYFQRRHELDMDGAIGPKTYELLFSGNAKKYAMSEGAEGDDVTELQSRLHELGYIESVTSYYGTDTVSAVKRFQELNKLTQDGSVGAQTLEVLYSPDVQANYLQYGSNNDTVKKCQQQLKKLGYLTTAADGNYGADTVNAVKRFQERNGLIADGFLGATTKKLLLSGKGLSNALVLGVRGSDVENVQKQLKKLGYMSQVTGYFGEGTEAAVMAFQKRNNLSADGKIGSQTMNKLFSDSAKKASGGSSSSGGGKGNSSSGGNKKEESTDKVANKKDVASLLKVAKSKLGCKYVSGAKGPNTFDCSGFVYWCLNQIGVKQGYMTSAGWAKNTKYAKVTSLSKVQAGDIICFKGHVGIAMGGGMMIDAGTSDGGVRTTKLSLDYWKKTFICAFRVL